MKKQKLDSQLRVGNAIDRKALKRALDNPKSREEIMSVLRKVRI